MIVQNNISVHIHEKKYILHAAKCDMFSVVTLSSGSWLKSGLTSVKNLTSNQKLEKLHLNTKSC